MKLEPKTTGSKKKSKQINVTHVIPLYGKHTHRASPRCKCQPEVMNKPKMGRWYLHQSGSTGTGQCKFVMKKEDV